MSQPLRLDISETFHRQKRTALIFSAALVVLAVAQSPTQGSAEPSLNLPLVSLVVAQAHLIALLWLGGLYYLVGFLLEATVSVRLNSVAARGQRETRAIELVLKGRDDYVRSTQQRLDAAMGNAETNARNLGAVLDQVRSSADHCQQVLDRRVSGMLSRMEATERQGNGDLLPKLLDEGRSEIDVAVQHSVVEGAVRGLRNLEGEFKITKELVQAVIDDWGLVSQNMERFHRDLHRLDGRIAIEHRLSFWAWEIAGAVSMFLLATVVHARTLAAEAGGLFQFVAG